MKVREIEKKWQQRWAENHTYQVTEDESKKKFYVLNMYIDFFLMTLFGGIYNIYLQKLLYLFVQIAIVRYIGGKIRRFIMMQPKEL